MNYEHLYDDIIQRGCGRPLDPSVYYEKHHIIPKSFGGSNDVQNLVWLTAKEHFVAHHLLWKFSKGQNKIKAMHAFFAMCFLQRPGIQQRIKISSRIFEHVRREYAASKKGIAFSPEHRQKLSEAKQGKHQSDQTNSKRSVTLQGQNKSLTHRRNISLARQGSQNPMFGRTPWNKGTTVPQERRAQISKSLAHLRRPVFIHGQTFVSIREASRHLGIHTSTIWNRIKSSSNQEYHYV